MDDLAKIPVLVGVDGIGLAMAMTADHCLSVRQEGDDIVVQLPAQARGIFPLMDGRNTVADIRERLAVRGVEAEQFVQVWTAMVATLSPFGILVLKDPSP